MNTEQAGNQTTGHQAPGGPAAPLTEPEQGMMTSWLRRRFGLDPESRERPGARERRLAGVATGRIQRLLARVRSTRQRARVWKPDVGSLRPELVQRFSGAIARRHERLQLVGVPRRPATPVDHWQDALELTLPQGVSPAETGTGATPGKMKGPSIFSVGQPIPRLSSQTPTASRPSSPSRVPSRSAGQAQHRPPPPRSRLFARVEEVAPAERKPSAEEEAPPVQQEADLESPELVGEPPLQDTEPSPGRERPSPPSTESAPPRAQPTIQRRAVDARTPLPRRRRQGPSRSEQPPVEQTQALPPARELGEPQVPPSETPISLGAPEHEVVESQAAEELPLHPAPGAPSPTPPQQRVAREPSPPRREHRAPRRPDAVSPRQEVPVHREGEGTPSGSSRAVTASVAPAQQARPTAPEEEPAARPRPTEDGALRHSPVDREQPQAPQSKPVESAPMAEQVQRQALLEEPAEGLQPAKPEDKAVDSARKDAELGPEMVLRRPPARLEAVDQQADKLEPVMEVTGPRSTPTVQRQAREAAGRQAAQSLSADGRRIVARARSKAKATLTKLVPARHRPPVGRRVPVRAGETVQRVPEASTGILDRVLRRRQVRHSPTLYGRGPAVQIGPDSSLLLTGRIQISRAKQEAALESAGVPPAFPIPPEARALIAAMEGQPRGSTSERSLPLSSAVRPSSAAQGGASIQRSAAERVPGRVGPPGGRSEPPGLPPPPPEEPSLPLAHPPAPKRKDEQTAERPSRRPDVLQRAPVATVGTLQAKPAVVQRSKDYEPDEEIDLSELARQVFPVIKRMLSIERERTRGRSL